ncbi:MAG: hypothetical protein A2445_02525 [Candidatus Jacksonbacteria bacterium RIFOXYC2_FULL_44_29]|nr:MAG: hypothetical protein A2240_02785 [Candidatus Jacksonbacteria bacterium RIFOXYA2_FULL_43_12]OGY77453.1 MAG: hypothetical protein A2295_01735 [Candidatus Jacksonbacteria bacterium RIFOXYB2_FULL_44_15]OGY78173.1 MAG: hypothetical protein A2550_06080 [Candidatus Jacksonbacteria bacterium RIFOXYD2_FULL_43_21]OGY80750.1 MAG: hypothetical protein A2445_02525 [Candidatus Jacksonbacteria bacterium RIFOXYC2_FULL_44_29]
MTESIKTLAEFGLTPNQTKVYLALLELGEARVQDIAKRAQVLRTTTYEVLEQLKQIGIISQYNRQNIRIYFAEPPSSLEQILETKKKAIQKILPQLESVYNISDFKPKIRYYEGVKGYKIVYEDTLTCQEKHLRAILSMQDMFEKMGEQYMENYIKKRATTGINLNVIRIGPHEVKPIWPESREELRAVRFAPENFVFPLTMYIYDNKVSLMSTKRENFSLIIESKEFMQTQKALFEILWQVSTKSK